MNMRSSNSAVKKTKNNSWLWSGASVIFGLACVVFGVAYLISINNLTVQGFVLQELKTQSNLLLEQHQDLQARALNLQSYSSLSPRLENLEMVAVEEIIYLAAKSPVIAKK
jgi:hypothetical protein